MALAAANATFADVVKVTYFVVGLTRDELASEMQALGVEKFRAKQIWQWIYGKGATEVRALDGVSVGFADGELGAIMGPSGSGKSTLLHCMAGLDTLTSGSAFIGDQDLGDASALPHLSREAFQLLSATGDQQDRVPKDTLYGRWVHDTGFSIPLMLLGFGAIGLAVRRSRRPRAAIA